MRLLVILLIILNMNLSESLRHLRSVGIKLQNYRKLPKRFFAKHLIFWLLLIVSVLEVIESSPRSPLSGCLYRDVIWGPNPFTPFKYSAILLKFKGA